VTDRIGKIRELGAARAYLLTSVENVRYVTGFTGDSSELLITEAGAYLFTDARYTEQAERDVDGAVEVVTTTAPERLRLIAKAMGRADRLALEREDVTLARFDGFSGVFGAGEYPDISAALLGMRAVKTESELALIRRAAAGNDVVLDEMTGRIHIGMSEMDVRAELLYQINRQGMESAFAPIVAAGLNSALPHATVTDYRLAGGDLLTLDFGCKYKGYCSDITRTFGLGNVDGERKNIYDIVKAAQQSALDAARPGAKAADVDAAARGVIESAGYGGYYRHGTGHGVGLRVHEPPVLNALSADKLEDGMVYTVEPGVYVPGLGGVRIEDMCIAGTGNVYSFSKEMIRIQ
jgi:Xaa-Pro aminopeptidase